MTRRPLLIDTDTASDDAVALIMALRHPEVRVAAITVVAGNVPLAQATQNALFAAELCDRDDVPVYAGATGPLQRQPQYAQWFHGKDGLGDQNYAYLFREETAITSRRHPMVESQQVPAFH